MIRVLWIGLGGFVGTIARYGVSVGTTALLGTSAFPYGTLAVNVLGSFALGTVMWLAVHTTGISPTMRLTLTTGLLGGFTTYSAFNHETFTLLQQRAYALAALYIAATVVICLGAGALGWTAARLMS